MLILGIGKWSYLMMHPQIMKEMLRNVGICPTCPSKAGLQRSISQLGPCLTQTPLSPCFSSQDLYNTKKDTKANTKSKNDDNNKTRQWRLPEQIESFVPLQVVGQHGLLWGLIPTDLSLDQIAVPQALLQKSNHSCFHNIPQLNSPPTWPTWPQGLLASPGETWLPSLVPRTQYPIQPSWKKVRLPVAKVQQIDLSPQKKSLHEFGSFPTTMNFPPFPGPKKGHKYDHFFLPQHGRVCKQELGEFLQCHSAPEGRIINDFEAEKLAQVPKAQHSMLVVWNLGSESKAADKPNQSETR